MVLHWQRCGRVGSCSVFYFLNSMFKSILIFIILVSLILLPTRLVADDAQDHFTKAHKFYLDSKPAQSEAEFKKALALDPSLSDARYYLSSIYFKQSRYEEAIKQSQMALAINPADLKSLIILGVCYQQLGLFDQSVNAFLRAIDVDVSSVAAHSGLGLVYCDQEMLNDARREYRVLKKIDRDLGQDLLSQIQKAQE